MPNQSQYSYREGERKRPTDRERDICVRDPYLFYIYKLIKEKPKNIKFSFYDLKK